MGTEATGLCAGRGITAILQGDYGPPTVTLMLNTNPCSQTAMCDPNIYNRYIGVYYVTSPAVLSCYTEPVATINNNPSVCGSQMSEPFRGPFGDYLKAVLCYHT